MTFLEYVCERLMGPPVSTSSNRSVWSCPRHTDAHPSFSTRPPKDGFKDRFQCFSCGFWGDVFDLAKEFYPADNFGQRRTRVAAWRIDYERECASSINHRGGELKTVEPSKPKGDVDGAWAAFMEDLKDLEIGQTFALQLFEQAQERCRGVSVEELIKYWRHFEDWMYETDQQHLAECNDPDCDAQICRAAKEWPPQAKEDTVKRHLKAVRNKRAKERLAKKLGKKGL
jgi:hypothetical protein